MAIFLNKVTAFTCTPVGDGGISTLGSLSAATFNQTRSEIEINNSTLHPVIIPGGRRDTTLTVTSSDISSYPNLVLKQIYTNVSVTGKGFDCDGTAETITISISRAILSEISEISINGQGDNVSEYTLTFKAVGTCAGVEPTVSVTVT
jgi:hypothetical protein